MERNDIQLLFNQRPALNQSLQLSLKVLEMNNLELQEFISNSLMDNPFLKDNEDDSVFSVVSDSAITNFAMPKSSREEFFQQIAFLGLDAKQKIIANLLYDYLCEHRYICGEFLIDISKKQQISYSDILKIIEKLQTIPPYGMFSFNFQDQIKSILVANGKYQGPYLTFMRYIPILLDQGMDAFKKSTGFDNFSLQKIIADIKGLGTNIVSSIIQNTSSDINGIYDCPAANAVDANVVKSIDGFDIEIGEISMPVLDRKLFCECRKHCKSQQDIKYIKERFCTAESLFKSVTYRRSTLLRIIREIVYQQGDFLAGESSCMVPIEAKNIADFLACHPSTVHRAISHKSIATPRGTFLLKDLMPKEVKSDNAIDQLATVYSVKKYIKQLVDAEVSNCIKNGMVYSDEDIAKLLKLQGVNISRRTISKYRNEMNIANTSQRIKEYKRLGGHAHNEAKLAMFPPNFHR